MATDPPVLPADSGAYVIRIHLRKAVTFHSGRIAGQRLPRGTYLYCGSAYGPGGLAARVGRHLKRGKSVRWHIDQLTQTGKITGVLLAPGGRECNLVALIAGHPGSDLPITGFGSSDCRHCESHLLSIPKDFDLQAAIPSATVIVPVNRAT